MNDYGNQRFPDHSCIHELFENRARQTPDAIALVFDKQQMTYKELNARTNQLAAQLLRLGVEEESLVAICVERSMEIPIGLLGILKAGAAYVPLDPKYPQDRLTYILQDTQARFLLTQSHLVDQLPQISGLQIILLDAEFPEPASPEPALPPVSSRHLAYTIYTSGSTGQPKGVQVEHGSVINLVAGQIKALNHPVTRFLYAYSFAFDGAVLLIWWTLLDGGTLVIAPEETEKDASVLAHFIETWEITHLLTFPSVYSILLEEAPPAQLCSLESVSVAGEACPANMVKKHHRLLPDVRLINQYGPTEATVGATLYITPSDFDEAKVPIGRPIENVQVYLLDETLQSVEEGTTGEIYIGGKGVARGYLNRPELTAERFITNPFSLNSADRLYRTGDLARRLSDGNLDFIGRVDFQVKLRGYRIELGEIEASLTRHEDIREACVLMVGENPSAHKLVAYLVFNQEAAHTTSALRDFLARSLPDYMIPAVFVNLPAMPLTPAGKVDRKALPQPDRKRPRLEQAYVAPETALQQYLFEHWSAILQLDQIGIHDKFFELGGSSLQAAQFISRLQKELEENIFIVSIFDAPTIAEYAQMLERDYQQSIIKRFGNQLSPPTRRNAAILSDQQIRQFDAFIPKLHLDPTPPKKKNPPAIFILAPPRSGTTLLRVMLAGHPQLFAANELQLLGFENLEDRHEAYSGKFSLWQEGSIRTMMELQQCTADEAKAIIDDYRRKGYSTQQFFEVIQKKISPKILVDKSPSYVLDPAILQKAERDFEDALYIHLYRHPYAMIKSFERMHMDQVMYLKEHPYSARELGELIWNHSHFNVLNFLKDIPQNRQFQLSYEDLVRDPEAQMNALCQRFNIDFHKDLLSPYKDIDRKMTDGLYQDSKPMGDIRLLQHGKIKAGLAEAWKGVNEDNFLSASTWKIAEQLNFSKPVEERKTKFEKGKVENDIAIVGMSVRLPGAENVEEFWKNLVEEKDVSVEFTAEELRQAGVSQEDFDDPDYVRRGMPLADYDCFDARFFGYTPREAALMDPQHRIFLEVAYGALEDAGYDPDRFEGKIGMFGGVARNTYLVNNVMSHPKYFQSLEDFTRGITQEKDFPATRVAYKLNLKGPALNVQTACSSSGVALHLACQSLKSGDSDMVLVGGGRIQPPVTAGHIHTEGHALSPDGYCRAFDADAQGMVRGNGMAMILIKRLKDALRDGDQIHALIKGTAIGNDGAEKIGFTAPGIQGQSTTIQQAYQKAGVSPASISYIEAHGTGTRIGDPIEIAGLTKAFSTFTDKRSYCAIGSVKSNIGHLDAGACIAGIIKTVLSLKQEQLPASLHFRQPNPQINFKASPFFVNDQLRPWPRGEQPRRAGVSSFGLGGTNAHIILEEAPVQEEEHIMHSSHYLFPLSAKTEEALSEKITQLSDFFFKNKALNPEAVAATLQQGRKAYDHRSFLIAQSLEEAQVALANPGEGKIFSGVAKGTSPKVVFLFPGGGAQYANMGLELYRQEKVFQEALDTCLELLEKEHQLSLRKVLYPGEGERSSMEQPLHAISLLFAVEYATAQWWKSKGIIPAELIGHSLGEYTAACIAGVLSLEDALALVVRRGRLFDQLEEGGMLSIPLSEKEILPFMEEDLSFAAINKPDHCVVSGKSAAIDRIKAKLNEQEIHSTRLHISVAAHSLMVEPILEDFETFLKTIQFNPPTIPIVSNLSGDWVDPQEIQQPQYWLKHLRETVRFSDGIAKILELDNRVLLEVGPGQTLSTFARQHPKKKKDQVILASLRHPKEKIHDLAFILKTQGQLWLAGVAFETATAAFQKVSLPTYPFARVRHWIAPKTDHPSTDPSPNPTIENENLDHSKITLPMSRRKDLLVKELKAVFHQLSGIPVEEMNEQATFLEMGFDSLFLTQATSKIKKKLKIELSFRQLFEEAPSLNALAVYADQQLPEAAFAEELLVESAAVNGRKNAANGLAKSNGHTNGKAKVQEQSFLSEQQTTAPPMPASSIRLHFSAEQMSGMEGIMQKQLQIMEQQLLLLRGGALNGGDTLLPTNKSSNGNGQAVYANGGTHSNGNAQHLANGNGHAQQPLQKKESSKKVAEQKADPDQEKGHGPWQPISKKGSDGLTDQERQHLASLIQRYTAHTKGSQQHTQKQRKHLADPRAIVGFNKLWKDMVYQIVVERSKGAKLWDIDGHEYVDYRMAFGISLFGHTPDFIQEAVREQLEKGTELGVLTPLASKVANLLCELTGMERVTLVNTGSEALSAAVRAARTATGKDRIAYFEGDYHGIADEMLARGIRRNGKHTAVPVSPGIPDFLVENTLVLKYDDLDLLDILKAHQDELAAVIIEPIQPNSPHEQRGELFHQIRTLATEGDFAFIFDEMITGFRIAPRGAQEWFGIEADLVAYGKIISGGLPMAALAGKSRYMDCFDGGMWNFGDDSYPEAGVTFFGGTFVKHPLSMAASYAALREIKKQGAQLYVDLNTKSARFAERLRDLFLKTKVPLKICSTASILAIKITDHNPLSRLFFYYLRLKGIHIKEKAALMSVAHTEEDLDRTYHAFEESIREMQSAGFFKITLASPEDQNKIIYPPMPGEPEAATTLRAQKETVVAKMNVPLTEGQQEVWVEQQLGDEAAAAYNLSSDIRLTGALDTAALQQAIRQLVQRHEALRTRFDREETTQTILPEMELEIPLIDLSKETPEEQKQKFEALRTAETLVAMDIFSGPLIRASIIKIDKNIHHLLLSVHHGIADGWSCGILATELAELYTAIVENRTPELENPKQISTYAYEQAQYLNSAERQAAKHYWTQQFEQGVPVLELPTDRPRPSLKTYDAAFEKISINKKLLDDLKKFSASEGTTLFVNLYTAVHTLFYRLSGQDDFVLGVVAAGQMDAGNQQLVAHSVNLLPVRMQAQGEQSFSAQLKKAREKILDAFEHKNYSLGGLVKALKLARDASRQPMISVLFNMDSDMGEMSFGDLNTRFEAIPRKFETFDVFINVKPTLEGMDIEWTYNVDLFEQESIRWRLAELKTLLQSILENPEQPISKLSILPEAEKKKVVEEWNDTQLPYPDQICIHQFFEQIVEQYPKKTALIFNEKRLSYSELNEQSNRLAHLLRYRGVKTGDFVGIYIDRNEQLLIGLLAILKCGGIYVPLDPSNPADRLQVIISDAEAKFLMTEEKMMGQLPELGAEVRVICIEQEEKRMERLPATNPNLPMSSQEMAYVIYTSGSTGRPKGVVIPHYAVLDHHFAIISAIGFDQDEVVLSVSSVSFDPSVQDFFMPLFVGATVAIASQEAQVDGYLLAQTLRESGATFLQATPATWRMLLTIGWQGLPGLRMMSIGEALTKELSAKLLSRGRELWNAYGPTETTIYSTLKKVERTHSPEAAKGYEPVGKVMNNVQIYILDQHQQPVPIGVAGEIYVGGVGVAPGGYFKRPELSAQKFVAHPLIPDGGTLYRTGDLGRYQLNGEIDFFGRTDFQVKIRGFRIELGEIESLIAQFDGVRNVVVVVREDKEDDKRLVAYLQKDEGDELNTEALRTYLQAKLPDYMIPAAFVQLEEFPLTGTLKINRKALPAPVYERREEITFVVPKTKQEKLLAEIWGNLLSVGKISATDDFFKLGGHSLIAVKMMAQIKKRTGKQLPLSSLLEHSTIQGLAGLLEEEKKMENHHSLVRIKPTGNKLPMYLVHGAGLHVLMFKTLAAHMDEEQPIYGLQARGLDGEARPLDRIEDIAAHYIQEIIAHRPEGPYALAGYSFGGLIAFEMAKQLKAMGREVAMLGVIDTVVREHITGQQLSNYQQLSNMGKKVAWNLSLLTKDPLNNIKYKSSTLSRRLKRLTWGLTHNANEELQKKQEDYSALIDQMNKRAFERYTITPYEGQIHLFRAQDRRFYVSDFEYLGWKPFAKAGVVVHDVPGDHLHLFNPPHGANFAQIFQNALDQLPANAELTTCFALKKEE